MTLRMFGKRVNNVQAFAWPNVCLPKTQYCYQKVRGSRKRRMRLSWQHTSVSVPISSSSPFRNRNASTGSLRWRCIHRGQCLQAGAGSTFFPTTVRPGFSCETNDDPDGDDSFPEWFFPLSSDWPRSGGDARKGWCRGKKKEAGHYSGL